MIESDLGFMVHVYSWFVLCVCAASRFVFVHGLCWFIDDATWFMFVCSCSYIVCGCSFVQLHGLCLLMVCVCSFVWLHGLVFVHQFMVHVCLWRVLVCSCGFVVFNIHIYMGCFNE